jgi:hypothetical protein
MIDFTTVHDDLEDEDFYQTNIKEIEGSDFTTMPNYITLNVLDDYFPECNITREDNTLKIQIQEHIYTKYWVHKYHASVFAEAMIKAIKRFITEGLPFSDSEFDDEDEVHLFVRWTLQEPTTITGKDLIENIKAAYDAVFERANTMLENSDSVLILGKDTGEGLILLKRIQTFLETLGYYTYIIKELPDVIGESVMQKVLRYGLSSRFVIIENTEATGHLYEFPHIAKLAELTSIVLQKQGQGSTWMFEDLYHKLNNIKKFEYTEDNLEEQIQNGIQWATDYLQSFGAFQKRTLPWFKGK